MAIESLGFPGNKKKEYDRTKDKHHLLSLFSRNDFSPPSEILKRSDELVELFRENVWKRKGCANNVFVDYAKTNDPEKIKYDDLLSTIFSFYRHDDVLQNQQRGISKLHNWIRQAEINDVIESLYGNNLDYISNKKNFLLTRKVLPAYLVVRSFKENDNKWLNNILVNFNKEEKTEIVNAIINLKNNLAVAVDSPKENKALLTQFNNSLGVLTISRVESLIPIENPENKSIIEAKGELNLTISNKTKMKLENDPFEDKILRKRKLEGQIENETSRFINFMLTHNYIYIDWKGDLHANKARFKQFTDEAKTESDQRVIFHNLTKIFGENDAQSMAAFSTMITLSPQLNFPWNLNEIGQEEITNIRNLTKAFEKSIKTTWAESEKLTNILSKAISEPKKSNFSDLNDKLAIIFYKNYYKDQHKPSKLKIKEFVTQPGVYHAIFSLRKLLLTNLLQTEYQGLNVLTPTENVWPSTKNPEKLAQEIINPSNLLKWEDEELVKALVFLTVENYAQSQKIYFNFNCLKSAEVGGVKLVNYPDKFKPKPKNGISFIQSNIQGLTVPITSKFLTIEEGTETELVTKVDALDLSFRNDKFATIPIVY